MPKVNARRPLVHKHAQAQPQAQAPQHGASAAGGQVKRKRPEGSASAHKKPKQASQPQREQAQPRSTAHHQPNNRLTCISIVDKQAAAALTTLLRADSGRAHGATLKSLTLAPHIEAKKATYAVTCQTMKYIPLLDCVLESSGFSELDEVKEKMAIGTVYVLLYEHLIGQGFSRQGPAERLVLRHKPKLRAALQQALKDAGAESTKAWLAQRKDTEPPVHPRWVRVNTLKISVDQAVTQLQNDFPKAQVTRDDLLPDMLCLAPGTSLLGHPLVASGALVLQSKASAMPAHALAPQPGWHCVDCCAAPGNKTTHLAARLQGQGRIFAFDKDPVRLKRLEANCQLTGAGSVVRGVLLDPSCSGSGTIVSRQDHLLPSWQRRYAALQRVRQAHADMVARGGPPPVPTTTTQPDLHAGAGQEPCGDAAHAHGASEPGKASQHAGSNHKEQNGKSDNNDTTHGGATERVATGSDDEWEDTDTQRVQQLASFQVAAIRHALTVPGLQRLVYSTCSIHAEENELVVQAVLPEAQSRGFELQAVFPAWHRRGLPYFPGCEKLVRTDPFEDDTDGFFVAVFERLAKEDAQKDSQRVRKKSKK